MSKIIIVGDTHFRIEEPHFSAGKEFCKWFNQQDFNKEDNIMVHLGDVAHHANPNPRVHDLMINWFNGMKFKKKYLIAGNHSYNRSQDSYAEEPLANIENTILIYTDYKIEIDNLKLLFLPFIYDKTGVLDSTMKEHYEDLSKEDYEINDLNYIFHHVEDSTINFGGEYNGINLDYLKGKRVGGHIHKRQIGYLGSALITRFDEKNKDSFILVIDTETKEEIYIEVPKFLDYVDLNYNDIPPEPRPDLIYDIIDAPNKESAESKFGYLYLREIYIKKNEEELKESLEEDLKVNSIKDHFINFCNKNKISKKIKEKLGGYIK